ncbi:MAG TPA: ester cyclase [Holophaga sp.]|nr:ester cyclase [Holophaga sp.]
MSTPRLVERFYADIWDAGDEDVARLLATDFVFRGSLGTPAHGHGEFLAYVRSVRTSLANYHCEILECVAEPPKAFARMRFSGAHVAPFRGFAPTGMRVEWEGAALFTFRDGLIAELWVLGDLVNLDARLRANAQATP